MTTDIYPRTSWKDSCINQKFLLVTYSQSVSVQNTLSILHSTKFLEMSQRERRLEAALLIISAINSLNENNGSTMKSINDFIREKLHTEVEHLKMVLHNGLAFGALQRKGGRYSLGPVFQYAKRAKRTRIHVNKRDKMGSLSKEKRKKLPKPAGAIANKK